MRSSSTRDPFARTTTEYKAIKSTEECYFCGAPPWKGKQLKVIVHSDQILRAYETQNESKGVFCSRSCCDSYNS